MLVLSQDEVRRLLDLDELIDALADAFVAVSTGQASVPPRVAAFVPDKGLLAAMPGYAAGMLETKLVSVFPGHEPSHQALIALFDPETGTPLAVMDGTHITATRTAAASALSTRLLARDDSRVLAILGTGVQARSHLEAVTRVREFDDVRVAGRSREAAEALARETGGRRPLGMSVADSFEAAVRDADVVCACTDASTPVLRRTWLASGTHVTSVGASQGGPELDAATVRGDVLAVESRVAFEPYPAGAHELQGLDAADAVELGELVAGIRPGRTSDEQVTVYKSMGHAAEDAAAARLVYERALSDGAGTEVDL
jgi:ornithine cyclodeaminase/alanine dehydrogenase-like protein (mu-crystallin family)